MTEGVTQALDQARQDMLSKRIKEFQSNRRQYVRISIDGKLTYRLVAWEDRELEGVKGYGEGEAVDISMGGIGFVTDLRLPEGIILRVLYDEEPWAALGLLPLKVVRCRTKDDRYRIGAKFVSLPNDVARRLRQLLIDMIRGKGQVAT
jgi:c-di-GMP-binding flagellar brake protein YcgR